MVSSRLMCVLLYIYISFYFDIIKIIENVENTYAIVSQRIYCIKYDKTVPNAIQLINTCKCLQLSIRLNLYLAKTRVKQPLATGNLEI